MDVAPCLRLNMEQRVLPGKHALSCLVRLITRVASGSVRDLSSNPFKNSKQMKNYVLQLGFAAAAVVLTAGCNKDREVAPAGIPDIDPKAASMKKFHGPAQPLGHGVVRAWTMFNGNVPVEVGVDISANALASLPDADVAMSLAFHPVKNSGTYTHVLFDWAHHGHEPGFYEVPHFDVHFYTQPESERLAIGPDNTAEFDHYPAPIYLPDTYFPVGGVPQMGVHWLSALAPELNGQPFTSTFILGSYDGKVTFYEPMLTLEWLLQQTSITIPIAQAAAVQVDGYYPTQYKVTRTPHPDTYTISLSLQARSGE
jgi:hypothetical protein